MSIKSVGIRDLKTHLSRYLKDVKDGSEIVISERGKKIAHITPITSPEEKDGLHPLLLQMSIEGKIILPVFHKPPSPPSFKKKLSGAPLSDAVIEDRR